MASHITYVGRVGSEYINGTIDSASIWCEGFQVGDLLVLALRLRDDGDDQAPSFDNIVGWEEPSGGGNHFDHAGTGAMRTKIAWRIAPSTSGWVNVSWNEDSNLYFAGEVHAYRGDIVGAEPVSTWGESGPGDPQVSAPSLNTDRYEPVSSLAIAFHRLQGPSQDYWAVSGTGWSEDSDRRSICIARKTITGTPPQATGTCTFTHDETDAEAAIQLQIWASQTGGATLQGVGQVLPAGLRTKLGTPETLQGVATLSPNGVGTFTGFADLPGVGTLSPTGFYQAGGLATLQGIGKVTPTAEGTTNLDYTRYDCYLEGNDQLWGLMAYKDESAVPATRSVDLRPARTDVGTNAMEMRPEVGDYYGQGDFRGGADQLFYHRPERVAEAFYWSEGFDISEEGHLGHLHEMDEAYDSIYATDLITSANGLPFVAVGTKVRRGDGNFPGTWTEEDPQSSGTDNIVNMVSVGDVVFAALDGTGGIQKRSNAGSWSDFSALQVDKLAYVLDRLIAVETDGTVIEINMGTGAQEGSDLDALAAGYEATAIFEAGGFINVAANSPSDDQCRVLHFALNDSGVVEKKAATRFPQGQQLYSGVGYLDKAYIGGGAKNTSGGYDPILYECYVDRDLGVLSYTVIAEGEYSGSYNLGVKALCPQGESVLAGWSTSSSDPLSGARDGIAKYDVGRQAFSLHLRKSGTGGAKAILSIMPYKGRIFFTIDGDGAYYEKTTYIQTASIIPSVGDWGNSGMKSWMEAVLTFDALPEGSNLAVQYASALPKEVSAWADLFDCSTTNAVSKEGQLGLVSQKLSLKITSTAVPAKTDAPVVLSFSVLSHATIFNSAEYRLVRFIRLLNRDRRDPQGPTVFYDPQAMREWLQSLVHGPAIFYEPGAQWSVWVESVSDAYPEQAWYDTTLGETGRDFYVVQLAMRGKR